MITDLERALSVLSDEKVEEIANAAKAELGARLGAKVLKQTLEETATTQGATPRGLSANAVEEAA